MPELHLWLVPRMPADFSRQLLRKSFGKSPFVRYGLDGLLVDRNQDGCQVT
jgi:hypothetical protein